MRSDVGKVAVIFVLGLLCLLAGWSAGYRSGYAEGVFDAQHALVKAVR